MAVVLSVRPLPIDLGPWEQARARFLQGLSLGETSLFHQKDFGVESLYYATDVRHKANLGLSSFSSKLKPLATGLEDFGRAMDVYANAASLVLSPLWGSVRVLLVLAQRMERYQADLMDLLEHIGDLLPTYRDLSGAFKDEQLKKLLADAYLSILQVCIDIKNALLKGSRANVTWRMLHRSLLKSNEFEPHLIKLRKQKNAVIERATLTAMLENEKRAKADRNKRLLDLLSTMDYRSRHNSLCAERHPGTCSWYLDSSDFRQWHENAQSAMFCCFGIPGCGKSVLSSAVVEYVSRGTGISTRACCFVHCDSCTKDTLNPSKIFGCLCRQLLLYRDIPDSVAVMIEEAYAEYRQPDVADIRAIFERLCQDLPHVFICIDGLDDLTQASQTSLIRQIEVLLAGDCRVKVHLSCREDAVLLESLKAHSSVMLTRISIAMDLKSYTSDAVSQMAHGKAWMVRSPHLEVEISETLVQEAKDMFLWVRLQLDEINQCDSEAEVREVLADLPSDLSQTYARIIAKIASSPRGSSKLEIAARALRWVICAQRPMTVDELEEAVTLEPETRRLDMTKIPRDNGMIVRKACGNLLTFNEQTRTLSFIHSSVEQYFRKNSAGHIKLDYTEAEKWVAERCLTYLSLEDFESQIVLFQPVNQKLHASAIDVLMQNSVQARPLQILSKLTKLLPASSNHNVDLKYAKVAKDPLPLNEQYRLLDYVVSFWTTHCAILDSATTESWDTFVDVTLHRNMAFEHRPWTVEGQNRNDLLQWTLQMGYKPFLQLVDWNQVEIAQAIQSACQTHHYAVLNHIVMRLGSVIPNKDVYLPQCTAATALLNTKEIKESKKWTNKDMSMRKTLLEESVLLLAHYSNQRQHTSKVAWSPLMTTIGAISAQCHDTDLTKTTIGRLNASIMDLDKGEHAKFVRRLYLDRQLTWGLCRLLLDFNVSCPLAIRMLTETFPKYRTSNESIIEQKFMDDMCNDEEIVTNDLLPTILKCERRSWPNFIAAMSRADSKELLDTIQSCTAWYFLSIRYKLMAIALDSWIQTELVNSLYKMYLLWGLEMSIVEGRIRGLDHQPIRSNTRNERFFSFLFIESETLAEHAQASSSVSRRLSRISIPWTTTLPGFVLESTTSNWKMIVKLAMAPVPCSGPKKPLGMWAFLFLFLIHSEFSLLAAAAKADANSRYYMELEEAWIELIRVAHKYGAIVLERMLYHCWKALGRTDDEFNMAQACDRIMEPLKYHVAQPDDKKPDPLQMELHELLYFRLKHGHAHGSEGHVFSIHLRAVVNGSKSATKSSGEAQITSSSAGEAGEVSAWGSAGFDTEDADSDILLDW